MKWKLTWVSLIIVCLAAVGTAALLYIELRNINKKLSTAMSESIQLEIKNKELNAQLGKFDGVEKADLLESCSLRARAAYSSYIRSNSVASKESLTTTYTPKSPDVLKIATEQLGVAEKICTDKFGS